MGYILRNERVVLGKKVYIYCTGCEDSKMDCWSEDINDAHVHHDQMCANMCVAKSQFKNTEIVEKH